MTVQRFILCGFTLAAAAFVWIWGALRFVESDWHPFLIFVLIPTLVVIAGIILFGIGLYMAWRSKL